VGEDAGSKLDKARALGVTTWDETRFRAALREAGLIGAAR
jgi:NAD-dependent DNA ligase